jgi:hypothetical protein
VGKANNTDGVAMTVTIKIMLIILLWNNDGSFDNSVAEVSECPSVETVRSVMEERRKVGQFKSWAAFCEHFEFGHDTSI